MTLSFDAILQQIVVDWDKAEQSIKLAEQVDDVIVNPAIYELRYAGRRMVEAFRCRPDDEDKAIRLMSDAHFDCLRARHDAIDAMTTKMVGYLEAAADTLGPEVVMACFPKFIELYGVLMRIRSKIADARGKREDREAIYQIIHETDLNGSITSLFSDFRTSEKIMMEMAEKRNRNNKRDKTFGFVGLVLTVLTLLWTVFGGAGT